MKYLRVRGEEAQHHLELVIGEGNTSACAEKSYDVMSMINLIGKYLRVRGEERWGATPPLVAEEIPPRARRRDIAEEQNVQETGNTSACAEKRG